MTLDGDTTNLPGGGEDALIAIDTVTNELIGEAVDAPFGVPDNIALTPDASKLYLTHSGRDSNKVTVYRVAEDGTPEPAGDITVGLNPFALAFVP